MTLVLVFLIFEHICTATPKINQIRPIFIVKTQLKLLQHHVLCNNPECHTNDDLTSHIVKSKKKLLTLIDNTDVNDAILYSIINGFNNYHGNIDQLISDCNYFIDEFQNSIYQQNQYEKTKIIILLVILSLLNLISLIVFLLYKRNFIETLLNKISDLDRLEALSITTGGLVHEFKNKLSVIIGYAEIMIIDKIIDENLLNLIIQMGRNANHLCSQFYNVPELKEIHLISIYDEIYHIINSIRETKPRITSCWINIPSKSIMIKINKYKLQHIILNIFNNAIYAVKQNDGNIFIESYYTENTFYLLIHDTGEGITDEVKRKMFDVFFTTKGTEGTGIGLSVVKSYLHEIGGSIHVENKDWTTFTLCFPINRT